MRGSSMPQISSGNSRGLAASVGCGSMRQSSTPLAERAAQRCDSPSPVFNAAEQQCVAIGQPHCPGIEDAVNRIGPIPLRQNRVIRIAGKQRESCFGFNVRFIRAGVFRFSLGNIRIQEEVLISSCCSGAFVTVARLHFEQGHQERKRRFRSLVFVDAIGMKSVSATACCCVIERNLQIVLAEKPAEDAVCLLQATRSSSVSPYTSRHAADGCACLYRLLIEPCLLASLDKESVRANGNKDLLVVAMLFGHKPLERIHAGFDHPLVVTSPSCQDERLRQVAHSSKKGSSQTIAMIEE